MSAPPPSLQQSQQRLEALLAQLRSGDRQALSDLFALLYDELSRLAHRERQSVSATLNTTGLVHEAFVKLAGGSPRPFNDRAHFMAVAATAMRQVLVDLARQRGALKRGSGARPVTIDRLELGHDESLDLALAVDDALQRLRALHPRQAQVVECRIYAGMEINEIAEALGCGTATVKRDWTAAAAWLRTQLDDAPPPAVGS